MIVIEPHRRIRVDPLRQPGLFRDAREMLAAVVMEKLRFAPFIDQDVFVTIVVVIAPYRARGDARSRLVDVGKANLRGYIAECAVA